MKQILFCRALALAGALIVGAFGLPGACADNILIYDFETNTEGWVTDWGLESLPSQSSSKASHGSGSLALSHEFSPTSQYAAVVIRKNFPKDLSAFGGFRGFSAWIFIPEGTGWQAQMYTRCGDDWEMHMGTLYMDLEPGWHKVDINRRDIMDVSKIMDMGIQLKNFSEGISATVYIDQVEMIVTTGSWQAGDKTPFDPPSE